MSTAVIIGGGISGLSAAYYLQKSAKFAKIILLESSKRVGGWVRTDRTDNGACFELGPRSIRPVGPPGFNTVMLAEELGLSDDILIVSRKSPAARNRYIYANGKLNVLPNKPSSVIFRSPPFKRPLILSVWNDIRQPAGSKPDESVYDFISRRFSKDLAEYAIDPLCRGVFAGNCRDLSVKSCFPALFGAEKAFGSVFKGFAIKSRQPKPKQKECDLHKRIVTEQCSAFSFTNGLQQFTDTLESACDADASVEILKDTACSGIDVEGNELYVRVNGDRVKADHVVSSIFAQDFAKLLPTDLSDVADDLMKIPAVNAVVVGIELQDVKMPVEGFGHLLPSIEDGKVLGVIYDSCTFPSHDSSDGSGTRFTVMMGGAWYDDLQEAVPSMDKEELGNLALRSVLEQLQISGTPSRVHVEILHNCIPQYLVGHSDVLDRLFGAIKQRQLPLSLVGSSYLGPSLNDCINNARVEMERITGTPLQ